MDLNELSKIIEQYAMRREERLELDRRSKEIGELENELKQLIMAHMEEQHVYVAGSPHVTVKLKITPKPTAKDWREVYQYVKDNDAFDILFRRLNEKALIERREQGVEVPGLDWFPVASLSVSRSK